jgi:hypothetical protein
MFFPALRNRAFGGVIVRLIAPVGVTCRSLRLIPTAEWTQHPETPASPQKLRGARHYDKL